MSNDRSRDEHTLIKEPVIEVIAKEGVVVTLTRSSAGMSRFCGMAVYRAYASWNPGWDAMTANCVRFDFPSTVNKREMRFRTV
jgi:hypothetical protein